MVEIYSAGIVHLSVCTDEPPDVMLAEVNRIHPTGLAHGWELDPAPTVAEGSPNPAPCNRNTALRHYLLVC